MRRLALLLMVLWLAVGVRAAVPNEDAVPAYAEEQTILQTEKDEPAPGWFDAASGRTHFDRHYIEAPGNMPEQAVVLQRGGNTWRVWRNGPLSTFSAVLLIAVPLALLAIWRLAGPAATPPETGRRVQRFGTLQRWAHWATAITFGLLALTGVLMLFGKKIVLPWLGHDAFGWVAAISKYVHNVAGPVFIACSVAMFLTFVQRNGFSRLDWQWLKRLGGLRGEGPVPAGFFNGGEKLWFWTGLTLLGLLMSITGLVLAFPYWGPVGAAGGSTRYLQQVAHLMHLVGATLYIAATMSHIYMGTLGTPGTYRGMRHGAVDESWAEHHHPAWLEQLRRAGRVR